MYKKSITRIETENESSQAELSNPALQDIIATNHVVLVKKPREERLSRACKALIAMIILGLVSIGIIVLTLFLAHSRNTLMAIISRSADENVLSTSNSSRFLSINQENLTTIANEQTENENWQETTTVSLTSDNLHTLTTPNVHISSSVMRTTQQSEYISLTTQSQSMKPYPSSNTIVNDQSTMSTTIQTTVSNQQTTFLPSTYHATTMMMMMMTTTENQLTTTMQSQEDLQTSSDNSMTSVVDSTSTLVREKTTTMPEETSFTSFINRHFNLQSSTIITHAETKKPKLANKFKNNFLEEDIMDDLLFS